MNNNATTRLQGDPLASQIEQLTELVVKRVTALDQRVQRLDDDTAEIRGLLRAIVTGIERLHAQMPAISQFGLGDSVADDDDDYDDDGFLSPPSGQFLH